MARFRKEKKKKAERPLVSDDFIYDDPDAESPLRSENVASDTPDEALRKMRRKGASSVSESAEEASRNSSEPVSEHVSEDASEEEPLQENRPRKVYGGGIMLDDDLQPIRDKAPRDMKRHPVLRGFLLTMITFVLLILVAAYVFHRISPNTPMLDAPENAISSVVSPVQTFFSGLTESVFGYFRSMKLRANIEEAYNELRAENEQLVYQAMLAKELQNTLSQFQDLSDEIAANANMQPVIARVTGKSDSNYFSTFTINKGTADGLKNYMAVTISGAMVGYTENVLEHTSTVRTVIDSEASIAALIQSSRDQGTVRGTLGIDSTPLCRMYYLSDDNLPRPGDTVVTSGVGMGFPKGIPIGTVRESTRGMEANKQYIVLEPLVDFQHLEYVIVLCYQPEPLAVEGREKGGSAATYVPMESARPSPVVPEYAASLFDSQATPDPNATETPTPEPTPEPTETPEPTFSPTPPPPSPTPGETPMEYQLFVPRDEPTATPTPSPEPTPTPYYTPDPEEMTFEED